MNRRPWQTRLSFAGLLVSVIGLGTLSAAMLDSDSRIAVPLLGTLVLVGVVGVAGRHRRQVDVEFLTGIMLLGLGVRFLLMALIHQSVGPYVFAPDAATYEAFGRGIVEFWAGRAPVPSRIEGSIQIGYYLLNASLFAVFGDAVVAPAILNSFLGVVVAVPIYHLCLRMMPGQSGVARVASVLVVFFPSLMLWSVLNIREAPAVFTVASAAYFFVAVSKEPRPRYLAGILVSLIVLTVLREYLTSLVLISGVAGVTMSLSRRPLRAFAVGGVLLVGVMVGLSSLGLGGTLTVEPDLERVTALREAMTAGAGSAFETVVPTTTVGGALRFLPTGLSRFLFAPYPWTLGGGSLLQAATLPEVMVWYLLLPFLIRGIYLAVRHDPAAFMVVAAMFFVISVAYALVEGNLGTAFRHRAQVLPLALIFAGLGVRDAWAVWAIRRNRALEARGAVERRLRQERSGRMRLR